MTRSFVIAGAGLTGCVAALRLDQIGLATSIYERRQDPRATSAHEGRSINLALSTRGLDALERVGLVERVLEDAVPMRGRMLHASNGHLTFQPYSTDSAHVLQSVNRDRLNNVLLDALDRRGIDVAFGHKLVEVELDQRRLIFETGRERLITGFDALIGADGAYSAVRARLQRTERFSYEQRYLEHGYKELTIPPARNGTHAIDPHALHIWPRGNHMMIALPNRDGSFTCTLFWPFTSAVEQPGVGDVAFEHIDTAAEIEAVFAEQFPDALALMPTLTDDYLANPTSSLVTVRCSPWYLADQVLVLGDAAHAVVPFYGQGANAALEDVTILTELIADERAEPFARFYAIRKPDTDALSALAHDNFAEMRSRVRSPWFRLRRHFEQLLHRIAPQRFVPLYEMVTFSRLPYAEAVRRDHRQQLIIGRALALAVVAAAGALALASALWLR